MLQEGGGRLGKEGQDIRAGFPSRVPNRAVLGLFARSHLVADQFICGHFGYTSLEAMAAGRPVLCYLRDPANVTGGHECPIINTHPERIHETLRWCLDNRHLLPELGRRGRAYVEKYHSISAVASRFAQLYCETADLPRRSRSRLVERQCGLETDRSEVSEGEASRPVPL